MTYDFLTFILINSSLSHDALLTKVWRQSINAHWRHHGNNIAGEQMHRQTDKRHKNIMLWHCLTMSEAQKMMLTGSSAEQQYREMELEIGYIRGRHSVTVHEKFCEFQEDTQIQKKWRRKITGNWIKRYTWKTAMVQVCVTVSFPSMLLKADAHISESTLSAWLLPRPGTTCHCMSV